MYTRSIKPLAILLLMLTLASCSKDFLVENPRHQIDLENFYTKPIDAEIGLTGAYSRIISKHMMQNLFFFSVSADEITAGTSARSSGIGAGDNRTALTSDPYGMSGGYTEPMVGIANINLLLKKVKDIPDNTFSPNRKNEIMGEAHFLRGYGFYILAMAYRDVQVQLNVPVSSQPSDNYLEKSAQADVLAQAMADFQKADSLLPERLGNLSNHDVRGRASKWAAKAFKARIHLWNEQWPQAFAECDAIIKSNQFAMAERWINIFDGENDDPEVIWQAQGQSRQEYDFIGVYRWYCDADAAQVLPPFMVEKKLQNAYEKPYKDVRLEYSVRAIDRAGASSAYGGRNVKHFKVPSGEIIQGQSDESRDKNTPLMRLAEVKLMLAEAIIQSGYSLGTKQDVLAILNELRFRAADPLFVPREKDTRYDYVAAKGCVGIKPLTIDQVNLQSLKDEKYRELAFEFVRWIDLLRWGKMEDNYASVMALSGASSVDRLYLAIPQGQIDANKGVLTQNPGY